jgi:arabinogalactan oligomer/maltooligosaccharide transport system permease protein
MKTIAYQLIAISIIVVVVFPIYWTFITSFKTPRAGLFTTEFHLLPVNLTLEAYQVAFQSPLLNWLGNTLIVTIPTLILLVFLVTPISYALSRYRFFGRKSIMTMFILVQLLPVMIAAWPLFFIMKEFNLLNLQGLTLAYTAMLMPFHVINLKLFFDTIPAEIDECAFMEGASLPRILYRIILPLAKAGLGVMLILGFMGVWNEYVLARTLLIDSGQYTFSVAFGEIGAYWQTPWPVFAAYSVVSSIPLLIVFIYAQKYLKKGLMKGALK